MYSYHKCERLLYQQNNAMQSKYITANTVKIIRNYSYMKEYTPDMMLYLMSEESRSKESNLLTFLIMSQTCTCSCKKVAVISLGCITAFISELLNSY